METAAVVAKTMETDPATNLQSRLPVSHLDAVDSASAHP